MTRSFKYFPLLLVFLKYAIPSVAILSTIWYQFTGGQLYFFHEAAYPLLYSETNLDTMLPFQARFSGREIAPFGWPLIGTALLASGFDLSLNTHSIYSSLFALFVVFVSITYCRVLNVSLLVTSIFLTTLFITFAPIKEPTYLWLDQVWIWPMNSYGVYDFFSLVIIVCIFRFFGSLQVDGNSCVQIRKYTILFAILFTFLCSTNGSRGFIMISGTALFSIFLKLTADFPDIKYKNYKFSVTIILAICSLLGFAVATYLTKGIPQTWQEPHAYPTATTFLEFKDRFFAGLYEWFRLFDAIPEQNYKFTDFKNITHLTNLIFSILIILIPLIRLLRSKKISFFEGVMTYRLIIVSTIVSISVVFGSASGVSRYLIPIAYASFFVTPIYLNELLVRRKFGLVLLFCITIIPAYISSVVEMTSYDLSSWKKNRNYAFTQFLMENNLKKGYVGPWESGALTINQLSAGSVRVAIVDPAHNGLYIHRHSDKKWYQLNNSDEIFVALPKSIANSNEEYRTIRPLAIRSMEFEGWAIDVYNCGKCVNFKSYE